MLYCKLVTGLNYLVVLVLQDLEKIKKTWASVAGLEEHAFKDNLEISKGTDAYTHLLKTYFGT